MAKRVVIAGGSGFIGRSLASALADRGYEVVILTRSPADRGDPRIREVHWDGRTIDEWKLEIDGAVAVVNLAGKNVNCRYTRRNLREIDQSRVDSVRAIADAINQSTIPPRVWVQASTTAIYGDAGETWCDETTSPGTGIPVQTATKWESAFASTSTPNTRRVTLRISFVLGRNGGVLATLSTLTRFFLGGTSGSGKQYISWIHQADLNRMFLWAIERADMHGVYVASGLEPVTNAAFMRSLRRAHHRPWSPRIPAWAVHVGAFFMRTEAVLALTGRRCLPKRFLDAGFKFDYETLDAALADVVTAKAHSPA